jgi:hypothetical protein
MSRLNRSQSAGLGHAASDGRTRRTAASAAFSPAAAGDLNCRERKRKKGMVAALASRLLRFMKGSSLCEPEIAALIKVKNRPQGRSLLPRFGRVGPASSKRTAVCSPDGLRDNAHAVE